MIDALGGMDAPVPQWLQDAQAPKLVVVPVGLLPPGGWVPNVLKIQILRIGQFYIVGGPAEFTIVSGLRVRRTVAEELGGSPPRERHLPGIRELVLELLHHTTGIRFAAVRGRFDDVRSLHTAGLSAGGMPPLQPRCATAPNLLAAPLRPTCPGSNPASDLASTSTSPCREHNSATQPSNPATPHRVGRLPSSSSPATPKNDTHRNGTFYEIQRNTGGSWTRVADDNDWSTKLHWRRSGATVPSCASRGMFRPILRRVRIESNTSVRRRLGGSGAISPFSGGVTAEFRLT